MGAGYGKGYFIAVYEGGSNGIYQNLYYTVFDTAGNVKDHGLLYQFPGAIQYVQKVAYDPLTDYFGIFLRNKDANGNYDASFLAFKLNDDGTLNKDSIKVLTVLDNTRIYGATIARSINGFVIAYETGYKWYTRRISISKGGTLSVGDENGPFYRGYRAYGGGSMDFVENGTKDYVVFAYEDIESSGGNYEIVVQLLDTNGNPLHGNYDGDYVIGESGKDRRYPAVAAKPAHSPTAYILGWSDTTDGVAEGSEYLPDFTEVSDVNPVPFFSNVAIGILALIAVVLFRRK